MARYDNCDIITPEGKIKLIWNTNESSYPLGLFMQHYYPLLKYKSVKWITKEERKGLEALGINTENYNLIVRL